MAFRCILRGILSSAATGGGPWDISTAVYSAQQFVTTSGNSNTPWGVSFKSDGTKMYVGWKSEVYEWSLSTPWDVGTASYSTFYNVSNEDGVPLGLYFKPDGTSFYIVGDSGNNLIEYNLSTAWDVSSASYSEFVAAGTSSPSAIFFKPDGTKFYTVSYSVEDIFEYNLSTAWDLSTSSFVQSFDMSSQDGQTTGLFIRDDGLKMYVIGRSGDVVLEYNLGSAWDVSSATFLQSFDISSQDSNWAVFFKEDGTKMYTTGLNYIYEYDIG